MSLLLLFHGQPGFTADAVIVGVTVSQHDRATVHTGEDYDSDHTIVFAFDRYQRGDNLRDVLIDLDARLTARESGITFQGLRFYANAVLKGERSTSVAANAVLKKEQSVSFTADAVLV